MKYNNHPLECSCELCLKVELESLRGRLEEAEREKVILRKALQACDLGVVDWWCGRAPQTSYKYIRGIIQAALNKTKGTS